MFSFSDELGSQHSLQPYALSVWHGVLQDVTSFNKNKAYEMIKDQGY